MFNMRWPWVSRRMYDNLVEDLQMQDRLYSSLQREMVHLRGVGFNVTVDLGASDTVTVGVTQGFTVDVMRQMLKDPAWLKDRSKNMVDNIVRIIIDHVRGGN